MSVPPYSIRPCVEADSETLAALVRELARYEKLGGLVRAKPDDFRRHLFGPRPAAEAILAEVEGGPAGFALFFPTFSTFRGQPGLYLEDLFVRTEFRGFGIGKALLAAVATSALGRGYGRLEWSVLDWNATAISFYESQGARPLDDWIGYRLDDEALARVASLCPDGSRGRPG